MKAVLDLCKIVEKRIWGSTTPLRQFMGVPTEVVWEEEGKQSVSDLAHLLLDTTLIVS